MLLSSLSPAVSVETKSNSIFSIDYYTLALPSDAIGNLHEVIMYPRLILAIKGIYTCKLRIRALFDPSFTFWSSLFLIAIRDTINVFSPLCIVHHRGNRLRRKSFSSPTHFRIAARASAVRCIRYDSITSALWRTNKTKHKKYSSHKTPASAVVSLLVYEQTVEEVQGFIR